MNNLHPRTPLTSHLSRASCPQESVVGRHMDMFYPPTQPNGIPSMDVVTAACVQIESGQTISLEFTHLAADGTTFVCAVQGKVCARLSIWDFRVGV